MSKMFLLAGAAALAIGAASTASAKQDKITICHFPGHLSAESAEFQTQCFRDFEIEDEGQSAVCAELGGEEKDVPRVAAEKGHRIAPLQTTEEPLQTTEECGTPPGQFTKDARAAGQNSRRDDDERPYTGNPSEGGMRE